MIRELGNVELFELGKTIAMFYVFSAITIDLLRADSSLKANPEESFIH